MRILHSKQAGTAGGLLSAASPRVETGLPKPWAWQPINSHPTIHGGGSAQPLGERGFPYPGMQHSQEVSSPPGSHKAKANPCRGSFSHDQGCWAPSIPPSQRKSKSHSKQTLWRNFFCLIILLKFSKMPQPSFSSPEFQQLPSPRDNHSWAAGLVSFAGKQKQSCL